jgi:hypothetical protein
MNNKDLNKDLKNVFNRIVDNDGCALMIERVGDDCGILINGTSEDIRGLFCELALRSKSCDELKPMLMAIAEGIMDGISLSVPDVAVLAKFMAEQDGANKKPNRHKKRRTRNRKNEN